ncbi:MAG TPA: hypothetical protein VEP73_10750 [Actinomycetota bacterium]|nr:hypothetical protein [Actinomycetota bacterium]
MQPLKLELALPPEPAELRARTWALAGQDPAGVTDLLGRGDWVADPLWRCWGPALEPAGMGRDQLRRIAVDYRRELWFWVMGERTWAQCVAGLLGRVRRRLPESSP